MIQHEQATCRSMKIVNLETFVGSSVITPLDIITPLDPIASAHIQCTLWLFYPFSHTVVHQSQKNAACFSFTARVHKGLECSAQICA
jgi:hypothetical protein